MNICTEKRAFTLKMILILLITVNSHFLLLHTRCFLRVAIHCAISVSTGEADEIAARSLWLLR